MPIYLIIVGIYFCKIIEKNKSSSLWLIFGAICLFAPLIYFKYSKFILLNVLNTEDHYLFNFFGSSSIPIGISFISFSVYSMMHDTKTGKFKFSDFKFEDISAYILIFPQLIAGPIIRPYQLVPQIKEGKKLIKIDSSILFLFFNWLFKENWNC